MPPHPLESSVITVGLAVSVVGRCVVGGARVVGSKSWQVSQQRAWLVSM